MGLLLKEQRAPRREITAAREQERKNVMIKQVIDISEHNLRQGAIDWQRVRAAGIDGVMLRAGWAGYQGDLVQDDCIDESIKAASAAGLAVGLYVYAYTKTPAAAHRAAGQVVEIAERHPGRINMPIAFCVWETDLPCLVGQGKEGLTDSVIAFLFEVERLGYCGVFHTYTAFALTYLNLTRLCARDVWIADYRGDEAVLQRQLGRRDYGLWQYIGERGECDGVPGGCRRSNCYIDYPLYIAKRKLNRHGCTAEA